MIVILPTAVRYEYFASKYMRRNRYHAPISGTIVLPDIEAICKRLLFITRATEEEYPHKFQNQTMQNNRI